MCDFQIVPFMNLNLENLLKRLYNSQINDNKGFIQTLSGILNFSCLSMNKLMKSLYFWRVEEKSNSNKLDLKQALAYSLPKQGNKFMLQKYIQADALIYCIASNLSISTGVSAVSTINFSRVGCVNQKSIRHVSGHSKSAYIPKSRNNTNPKNAGASIRAPCRITNSRQAASLLSNEVMDCIAASFLG